MEGAREILEAIRHSELAAGRFRGLLHIVIGRKITRADGSVVSAGLTWRELAQLLKQVRWDRDYVRELGLDPQELPARDRQRFWYATITAAGVDSAQARADAEALIPQLTALGFQVGPPPRPG